MAGKLIYVAGNPNAYPIEYYDQETGDYQGLLPSLLHRFAQESGCEVRYYSPGTEDQREELAGQQQVDLISGCRTGESFSHIEGGLLPALTGEIGGETSAFGFLCTSAAPDSLRGELEDFLAGVGQEARTGLLLEAVETVPPTAGGGLALLSAGLGVTVAVLTAALAIVVRRARRQAAEALRQRELDPVTGLGNLEFLSRKLPAVVNDKNRVLYRMLYFYTDMERLERLGGREASHAFLRHMALVLQEFSDDADLLVRADGGFVLLRLSGGAQGERGWLEAVLSRLKSAPEGEGNLQNVRVSVGILPLSREDWDLDELLFRTGQCAKAAWLKGKDWQECSFEEVSRLQRERQLQEEVRRGLKRGEFQLYLQFYVSARSLRVKGAEALCRWDHPKRGFQTPDRFIPLLEREDLIGDMDYYMLEKVCAFLEGLDRQGVRNFSISCNCSRRTFSSADFIPRCVEILKGHAFLRERLVLEITESSLAQDMDQARQNALALKELGVRIVLDDFGEGFTSFYDLLEYPVDGVKLDKSLIDSIGTAKGDAILRAIAQVCCELDLTILAEGVETEVQALALRDMGCGLIQGYHFYHPVPDWDARQQLLERWTREEAPV